MENFCWMKLSGKELAFKNGWIPSMKKITKNVAVAGNFITKVRQ